MRAKARWGYSSDMLERWEGALTISPEDIRDRPVMVALIDEEIAGFYSLRPSSTAWELDNLWVRPESMRRGIGSALLAHALATAARGGAREVTIDADPNAESFYLKSGAIRRGEIAAPIPGDSERVRPQLAFEQGAIRSAT